MKLNIVVFLRFACLCIFTGTLSAIAIGQNLEQHPNVTPGRGMTFPVEGANYFPPESEGLLGECFPWIHGNDAIHFDYLYTGGLFNNVKGGRSTKGNGSYVGCFSIGMTVDTEKLGLWENGTFYMNSIFSHGPGPTRRIGDYQNASVFAYETPAQVAEYWYEHRFFDELLNIRIGKQDAGVDFFFLESTGDFINSSMTLMPTTTIPSVPDNAWGALVYFNPCEHLCIKAGVYDAERNGGKIWMSDSGETYTALQGEYHYTLGRGLKGTVYAGGWYDTSEHEIFNTGGLNRNGNYGGSYGFEQMIMKMKPCDPEDDRGLTLFAQYGHSRKDRTEIDSYFAVGLTGKGLFCRRPDDVIGLAYNRAHFARGFRIDNGMTASHEGVLEGFYKIQINDNVSFQPDVQYIFNTGGMYRDAVVTGMIFQVVF